jgi:hypothetical protein
MYTYSKMFEAQRTDSKFAISTQADLAKQAFQSIVAASGKAPPPLTASVEAKVDKLMVCFSTWEEYALSVGYGFEKLTDENRIDLMCCWKQKNAEKASLVTPRI